MKTLIEQVEHCLEEIPETRNSDITLTHAVWKEFSYKVKVDSSGKEYVYLQDMYELPHEDSIKRFRAQIQNDKGQFLPTEWVIAKQRRINEEVWKKAMGYVPYNPIRSEDQSRLL